MSSTEEGSGRVRFKTSFRNTIYDLFKKRGWRETDSDLDWDIHWADRDWVRQTFDSVHFSPHQKINHFRNGHELCRKDHMVKNLKRKRRELMKEGLYEEADNYLFFPQTYVLPGDYALFVEEYKKNDGQQLWIMKPIGRSQGRGIFLFHKLSDISQWRSDHRWRPKTEATGVESYVVQAYIERPHLVGGRKYDLRLYALVTSFMPLEVYMCRMGFARFSFERYNSDLRNEENMFVHLTNVAVQKTSDSYDRRTGGKWELRKLKLFFVSRVGAERTEKLFYDIQLIVLRSLLSVQKVIIQDKHCFELFGYDVIIDQDLKPWLLEVNASPSLTANTPDDYELKMRMLDDVMDVLDLEQRRSGEETTIGSFDLICKGDPLIPTKHVMNRSMIGCDGTVAAPCAKLPEKKQPATAPTATRRLSGEKAPTAGSSRLPTPTRSSSTPSKAPTRTRSTSGQSPIGTLRRTGSQRGKSSRALTRAGSAVVQQI